MSHGKKIGLGGKRLAVAGNSVGGNMAAVVSLMNAIRLMLLRLRQLLNS
jgi:acetyl esterase/lipase